MRFQHTLTYIYVEICLYVMFAVVNLAVEYLFYIFIYQSINQSNFICIAHIHKPQFVS